jgi:hypothetical protein
MDVNILLDNYFYELAKSLKFWSGRWESNPSLEFGESDIPIPGLYSVRLGRVSKELDFGLAKGRSFPPAL